MKHWMHLVFVTLPLWLVSLPGWADPPAPTWTVVPPVAYPDTSKDPHGQPVTTYRMTVLVKDTTFDATKDYWLRFDGRTPLLACKSPTQLPSRGLLDLTKCVVRLEFSGNQTQATFSQIPDNYAGAQKFTIVPDTTATPPPPPLPSDKLEIAFALTGALAVRAWALLVVGAMLGVVLLLLNSGRGRVLSTGLAVGLLRAAFIDTDTRTYSLSKLQFYVWGFAVISSYIYLTMARSLVQGAFELAAVPDNLALLMGLSVGTTVTSVGVTSLAGNKGSGDVDPTPSDLITSGGVVAPERLLHLLWTLIGGLAFVFFTFSIAPETIDNLPTVPNGFLELMGVSAAGYIGGKVARGPGPNIQSIAMDRDHPSPAAPADPLFIQIDGTFLATEGAKYLMAQVRPALNAPDTPVQLSQPLGAGSVVDTQKMATRIKTSVAPVPPTLVFAIGNRYRFTIANPDGEQSVCEFDVT
jgi:hypothetical protein